MALTLINSPHSFIRFNETEQAPHCIWGDVSYCLPVYEEEDIYFQFIMQGTPSEIDALCTDDAGEVEVSLINDCNESPILVFTQKPQRFRLSETQVVYNWMHGVPLFGTVVPVNSCFKIQVAINTIYDTLEFCSNCFERIGDPCFTSVIEYGNEGDAFGFKYCNSGDLDGSGVGEICEPTTVQFINVPTLSIPYTALLANKYGDVPTVQAYIFDGSGQLINAGITISFDGLPVTMINLDFGGSASGIVIIR